MTLVYYWRHNFGQKPQIVAELYKLRLGAVDYAGGMSLSTDPATYQGRGKSVITLLNEIGKGTRDCLLACDYRLQQGGKMVVGRPNTISGLAGEVIGGVSYKVLRLQDEKELDYSTWPVFAACHPQQGTFCRWKSMENCIATWYHTGSLPVEVGSLTPGQLEVLCYEYMKDGNIIERLLCPIGRALREIDIVGIAADGSRVFAQVTFATNRNILMDKASRLLEFGHGRGKCIMFCPVLDFSFEGVECISIPKVFEAADKTMLRAMLSPM